MIVNGKKQNLIGIMSVTMKRNSIPLTLICCKKTGNDLIKYYLVSAY